MKKSKTGMFRPSWTDLDGRKLGPIRGHEVSELHRLWREHGDIRRGELSPRSDHDDGEVEFVDLFALNGHEKPQEPVSRPPVVSVYRNYQLGLGLE